MSEDVLAALEPIASERPEGLTQADLRTYWASLGLPEDGYPVFEDVFRAAVDEESGAELYFRPGGWVVKASGAAVKSAVTMGLLTVALAASHATGIPMIVLPTILPMLVDLERVRLSKSEEYILAQLTLTDAGRQGSPDELYAKLPESARDQIAPAAFRDFLEKCRQAGLADVGKPAAAAGAEPTYVLRAPGSERFRVTFI